MPDSTYQPKVYRRQGGDELVVANGGIITVESGGQINVLAPNGAIYFVDANIATSGDGLSWGNAFKTMAEAFAVIASGDTIIFRGKVREQLTSPVGAADVTIIGAGNRPHHADTAPAGAGTASNTWTTPATGSTDDPLLTIRSPGWRLFNILFAAHATDAAVFLERTAEGADEYDASHAQFIGCKFASGQDGIENSGGCNHVDVIECMFHDLTGYCIKQTTGAGIGTSYRWRLLRNQFLACANWLGALGGGSWIIEDNHIANITTALIDTSSGPGFNRIVRNSFDIAAAAFDPTGGVTGDAKDVWSNYLTDTIETGLPAD